MPPTRRDFLRTGFSLGLVLALRGTAGAAGFAPGPGRSKLGLPPRGLMFDASDLPRIRANLERPEFAEFWRYMVTVDFAADEKFLREELRLTNHVTDMSRAQVIMLRSAFVNLITPDPRHVALSRAALAKLLEYPRWDWLLDSQHRSVGVMRGAGSCLGLALASEWLVRDLSAEEQAAIDRGMATEGGPAQYRALHDMTHHDTAGPWSINADEEGLSPMQVTHWPRILDDTNLRIIATAGLAAAAAHLDGRHPDVPQWLEATRASLKYYADLLPKDGSFPEGVGYWDYTFSHYIFTLEVLRRRFGIDDRALIDFPAQARFTLEMMMPTIGHPDDCINIGDSASAAGAVPLAWIAREYRDANAQWQLLRPGAVRSAWTTAWAAVWYDPAVPARFLSDARLDHRQELGIVVSRTGWSETDSVVAFRSGGPVNHEHADRNSVIFTAHGERLLNDPLHASYSTKDPKWLLRQTAAHTSVLIDGHGHIYHDGRDGTNSSPAQATIQDYRTGPDWMTVTSDAGDAYRRAGLPARRVQRTLVYLKPDVLLILDRVTLESAEPVQARFQAFNDDQAGHVSIDGESFMIERPNASLRGRVGSAGSFSLAAAKLPLPAASGSYPYAELRSAPAQEHMFVTVCTAAPQGSEHGHIDVTGAAGEWHVAGSHRGRTIEIRIATEGELPKITL